MRNYCKLLNREYGTWLMIGAILEDFPEIKEPYDRIKLWLKVVEILESVSFVDSDDFLFYISDAQYRIFQENWGDSYGLPYF